MRFSTKNFKFLHTNFSNFSPSMFFFFVCYYTSSDNDYNIQIYHIQAPKCFGKAIFMFHASPVLSSDSDHKVGHSISKSNCYVNCIVRRFQLLDLRISMLLLLAIYSDDPRFSNWWLKN
jgi:uncharacterized protein with WD repeat